jgi:2-polyprenyl-6-methoxyphenol hydroxylase-like FAD-dependent oxidoreductase
MPDLPVLVVGGGIGGLAAALTLARKGLAVRVFEQGAEFKEIGAGIQLGPNVFRMFELLGLTDEEVIRLPVGGAWLYDGITVPTAPPEE